MIDIRNWFYRIYFRVQVWALDREYRTNGYREPFELSEDDS